MYYNLKQFFSAPQSREDKEQKIPPPHHTKSFKQYRI